jgi:hypothetical protein
MLSPTSQTKIEKSGSFTLAGGKQTKLNTESISTAKKKVKKIKCWDIVGVKRHEQHTAF